jgi:uncharacterized protein
MKLTLNDIKQNPQIDQFLKATDEKLRAMGYTDHGKRHANIIADRAQMIARKIGLTESEIEYCGIAGYCHDMGNFLGRDFHHHWASLLFHQVFGNQTNDIVGLTAIMEAVSDHDKDEATLTNKISAILIIADKSDVHKDRVRTKDVNEIRSDIHDRVNYSVFQNELSVNPEQKIITLRLQLDTTITPVMDYFEIFIDRMNYCRVGAEYLGYKFRLSINEFDLV